MEACSYDSRSEELNFSDSDDIFDYTAQDNELINLDLRQPDQTTCKIGGKAYMMSDGKRGRCLIINNYEFKKLSTRRGSEVDVNNLRTVFKELRFQVIMKTNIKSHDFAEVIANELQNPDHKRWGMFVLIIMSHGSEGGKIYGTDDVAVDQHALLKRVYNCKALKEKPKFIVIQACAGNDVSKCEYDNTRRVASSSKEDNLPPMNHSYKAESDQPEDVLILKSAFDGFASIRYEKFGTPFIRALVEALYKHAHHHNVKAICKQVQNKIRIFNKKAERDRTEKASLPSYISFLNKKLHLFPGIPSTDQSGPRETLTSAGAANTAAVSPAPNAISPAPTRATTKSSARADQCAPRKTSGPANTTGISAGPSGIPPVSIRSTAESSVPAGKEVKEIIEPKCLSHVFSSDAGAVHSVNWLPNQALACGCDGKIEIRDEKLKVVKSRAITGSVYSVYQHGKDYLALVYDKDWKVDLYYSEFSYRRTIVSLCSGNQMAVRGDRILVIADNNKNVKLYTTDGACVLTVICYPQIKQAWGIQFQDDCSFIVSDFKGDKVLKFNLKACRRPVWTCTELQYPTGISIDTSGFIYVTSGISETIYLLTPSGSLLKMFSHPELYDDLFSISLSRNVLAVGSFKGVQLFNILF